MQNLLICWLFNMLAKITNQEGRCRDMKNIGMLGAGSWGMALCWVLQKNGHKVTVWSALDAEIAMLKEKVPSDGTEAFKLLKTEFDKHTKELKKQADAAGKQYSCH